VLGGEKFKLTIDHVAGSHRAHVVQILMKQLADVGITLKSRGVSGRQFFAGLKARQHELGLLSWNADYFDPHSNAHTFCRDLPSLCCRIFAEGVANDFP
jgi:peptide/nickel transport system substrate-binding protein